MLSKPALEITPGPSSMIGAEVKLRDYLDLKDGDYVEVEVLGG